MSAGQAEGPASSAGPAEADADGEGMADEGGASLADAMGAAPASPGGGGFFEHARSTRASSDSFFKATACAYADRERPGKSTSPLSANASSADVGRRCASPSRQRPSSGDTASSASHGGAAMGRPMRRDKIGGSRKGGLPVSSSHAMTP